MLGFKAGGVGHRREFDGQVLVDQESRCRHVTAP
jgi:hypothetical protein